MGVDRDPLEAGPKVVASYNLPVALKRELERQAKIDGYERVSPYLVQLLIVAIRNREMERRDEEAKRQKR